jgi:hypothetical protein
MTWVMLRSRSHESVDGCLPEGWLAVHDVTSARGGIDAIAIGPGGLFTIDVKADGGRLDPRRLDVYVFAQAYAKAEWVRMLTGHAVTPLLVFSRAKLARPLTTRHGVTVLGAGALADHLRRLRPDLGQAEVESLHGRLASALSVGYDAEAA